MSKKRLFYKSIIWQIIGMIWISLLSYLWFGNWIRSLSFTSVVVVVSIFAYILYELAWERFMKKNKWKNFIGFYRILYLGLYLEGDITRFWVVWIKKTQANSGKLFRKLVIISGVRGTHYPTRHHTTSQ